MADLSKTIQIVFETVDNAGTGIKAIGEGIESLGTNVQQATQPLADATTAILAMETAAAALGAALVKVAVDEAGKFEQAFTEIQTIIQLPADELAKFEEDVFEYAKTSTQSFEQINAAIYNAVSAGVKYEDALTALAEAEKLAVGGNASLEESIKLLTATTNAYGPAISGAGEAADIFFKTVELGATTVPELNSSLGNIVPVAAALGVPLQEVGAALATLTANGIGTSEATTGLKAALDNIISPSKGAQEAASALGVEFNATALQSKGFVGLLDELYKATGGNAEEMKKLFGSTEAYAAVMSLTNDGATKLNDNLGKIENSAGAAAAAYDKMSGTLENVNQKLTNSIDAVLIRMGDEVLDEYKGLLTSFTDLFNTLADSIDEGALDAPLSILEEFFTEFSRMVDEMAAALPDALAELDWSEFEAAMANLSGSLDGLFDGVDLTTPEGLASVLQTLIDVGSGFINVTSGIIQGLTPLFEIIGSVIKAFTELDPEIQTAIGYFLGLSTTVNTVAGVVGSFGEIISGAGGLIASLGKLNPALQAVAVAFAAFELGAQISQWTGLDKAVQDTLDTWVEAAARIDVADDAMSRSKDTLAELGKQLGDTEFTMADFNQAVEDGKLKFNDITGEWELAGNAAGTLGTALEEGALYFDDWGEGANLAGEATTALATSLDDATKTTSYWNDALDAVREKFAAGYIDANDYAIAVKAIDDAAAKAGVQLSTVADDMGKTAEKTKKAAEESEKFALEWEKILSAERTAIFEAQADIQVAQIEADAERAVAAMDMLSQSFQSTGDVLTELIGLWAGLEGMDQQQITEWIEREYQIREDLAQAQIDLVEAEIARMEAQTRLLERGGVELTIQSDGLEPELEAFMFKIIDRVRVAVAGSYEEFLLGCGAGA